MSIAIVPLLLGPLLVLATTVALVVALVRRPVPAPSQAAEAARRHGMLVTITAWLVAGLIAGPVIAGVALVAFRASVGTGPYAGVVTALYPTTVGLLYLAVHALGERTWPRPEGPVRRAALAHRQVNDVAPRLLRTVTWTWAGGVVVALVIGGATAAADGRSFTTGGATHWSTTSPYPGWYYGAWLLPAVLIVLAATEAALRLVAARPAIVDADPAYDAGSRRLSAHRALRGPQLVLGLTLAGVLLTLGYGPHHAGLTALGYVLDIGAGLVAITSLVLTATPAQAPVATSVVPAGQHPPEPRAVRDAPGALDQA